MKPDDERIKEEITKLKELKPRVRRFSLFGDDNHARIDAQITTLEEGLTENQIYDRWPDEDAVELLFNAMGARAWMDTGETPEGDQDLVSGWETLAS